MYHNPMRTPLHPPAGRSSPLQLHSLPNVSLTLLCDLNVLRRRSSTQEHLVPSATPFSPRSPRPDIGRALSSSRRQWHVVPAERPLLLHVTAVRTVLGGTLSVHPPPLLRALVDEVGTVMSSIVHHALCLLGWGRSRRQPLCPWFLCWGAPRRRPLHRFGSSWALNNSRFTVRAKYVWHTTQRLPLVPVLVVPCKK